MKNKQLYLLSLISASLLTQQTGANASPLVSIGDNADIFFNGSSSLRWQSNVFRDEDDEIDDLLWSLSPGFELNVGRGLSNADLSIITRYDILRYQDLDDLNTELFHIKAIGSYKTSRLDLNGSISFDENQSTSGDNNVTADLIEFDTFNARLDAEYRFSPKFSFGTGVNYSEREYKAPYDDVLADRETIRLPFDIFYELTPKVDLSLGYVYTTTDVEETVIPIFPVAVILPAPAVAVGRSVGDYKQDSHFFNIGARGNLLPKLTGFFKIGYRTRSNDDSTTSLVDGTGAFVGFPGSTNRDDSGMLGLDADLTWSATPKITARLGLSRDFGVGGEGQSTENTSVDLNGSYSINSNFAASANLGYTIRDYTTTGDKDNQTNLGLRLSYSPNQYWSFSTVILTLKMIQIVPATATRITLWI